MALNLRSPIFLGNSILTNGYNLYKIYIYSSTKPSVPEYTIRKNYNANFDAGYIDVSELIRDYLEINFGNDYISQCVKVTVEFYSYDGNGNFEADGDYGDQYAFDSYSYFEENNFDVDNSPLMISNRQIFALADNLVRIPINTKSSPTVTFLKEGKIVGSQQYTNTAFTSNQIKYATIGGTYNFDNYKERVLTEGGVYEETKCLKAFLNGFEVGEADEVRIFSDTKPLETIKIKTLNECKYEPKKVTFINKFGALQDMYFFKKSVEKMNVTKETYKSNILDSNYSYNRSNHVQRNFNVIGNESVTLSSGYLSEEYNEVFKQLLLSEKVWLTNLTDTEEQVLPINVKTSNITYKTSLNDKLVEYTFEFDKSFDTINNIR
jgi:hypothetical protein